MPVVKQHRLADQVVARIRTMIADGTYRLGERLPAEPELCDVFGVGRSTIREAMRVLANRGLVSVRQGDGTFVAALAPKESFEERLERAALDEIYEARLLFELPLAELAAERRDRHDVASMRSSLRKRDKAIKAGDARAYIEHDFAFHLAVAKATKNKALFAMYESFVAVVQPLFAAATTADYLQTETDSLHAELCEAIGSGDIPATRRLVVTHLEESLKKTKATLT